MTQKTTKPRATVRVVISDARELPRLLAAIAALRPVLDELEKETGK